VKKINFFKDGIFMNFKLILISTYLTFTLLACQDANPIQDEGKDVLQAYGKMQSDTLFAEADTFLVAGKVNTGSSPKLLLGSRQGYEGRFLVKFSLLPNDTIEVDSLRIIVSAASAFGDDMNPLLGSIYRVTESWDETVNTDASWDYSANIDRSPETTASFEFMQLDTTVYTDYIVNLPTKLVDVWRDTTNGDQNFGLLFDFSGADHIMEFASREGLFSSRRPRLVFAYRIAGNDTVLHDTSYASVDASLINFTGVLDPGKRYISAGYVTNAFFKFNFDSIPKGAYMASVQFHFTEDSLSSLVNPNHTTEIYLRNVETPYNELPSYEIDSTFTLSTNYSVVLTETTPHELTLRDSRRAVISKYFVQDIINEFAVNGSFFLQYVNPGNDVSVYAVKGTRQASGFERPYIILEYYLQSAPRL
jgi:hypothetical protein